jgi:hypothetical protein
MNKTYQYPIIVALLLTLSAVQGEQAGEEYRNWCRHSALAEKVVPEEQDKHIQACIDELVEVDRDTGGDRTRRNRTQENDDS